MVQHKVIMRGKAVRKNGASPVATGAVLTRLQDSLHGAVDVAFRGSSAAGRRQHWLRQAGVVHFQYAEKISRDEMALYFEGPTFAEVAEDYFAQRKFFDDGPREEDSAFDVLADAACDVLAAKEDSDRYDVGLLRRFHRFEESVFQNGVEELLISGHRLSPEDPCRLQQSFSRLAQQLYLQTPEPMRVRVAGKLDVIQASTLAFVLLLPNNERVRGVWKRRDFETLRDMVSADVVASGTAVYRPSGSLLRIDADILAPQRQADRFFATVPPPTGDKLDVKSLQRGEGKRGGMAAIWGKVSAEESDEDFLAAVAEMG